MNIGFLAVDIDLTLIWTVQTVEDIHQSRFSGPVLTEESENCPLFKGQIDMVICKAARESFPYAAKL